jgi:hypothetical protein
MEVRKSKRHWTPEEDALLIEHYPHCTDSELGEIFPNKVWRAFARRAARLGIIKTAEYKTRLAHMHINKRIENKYGSVIPSNYLGHLDQERFAYLAGLIDTDGHIRVNEELHLDIGITNTHPGIMEWLGDNIEGGSVYWRNGKIGDTINSVIVKSRRSFALFRIVQIDRAIGFLRKIAPYLVQKRDQANLILQTYDAGHTFRDIEYTIKSMKKIRYNLKLYRKDYSNNIQDIRMSPLDWAYLAGSLDGDGCMMTSYNYGSYTASLILTTINPDLLKWLNEHNLYPSINHRKTGSVFLYNYYWHDEQMCYYILKNIAPYLIIKKDQAELLLDYIPNRLKLNISDRDSVKKRLSTLKQYQELS